jgi:hypothetical protein
MKRLSRPSGRPDRGKGELAAGAWPVAWAGVTWAGLPVVSAPGAGFPFCLLFTAALADRRGNLLHLFTAHLKLPVTLLMLSGTGAQPQ